MIDQKIKIIICCLFFMQRSILSGDYGLKYEVNLPMREKLEADFKKAGLFEFAEKAGIIDNVQGHTLSDQQVLAFGINAQIFYNKSVRGTKKGLIFLKENQDKLYSILFQNNLPLFEMFKQCGILN